MIRGTKEYVQEFLDGGSLLFLFLSHVPVFTEVIEENEGEGSKDSINFICMCICQGRQVIMTGLQMDPACISSFRNWIYIAKCKCIHRVVKVELGMP